MEIKENYSLKNYNTFGVDVNTKYYIEIINENELYEFLSNQKYEREKLLVIGEGSNILFSKDYDGIVLKYLPKEIKVIHENENEVLIEIDAGKNWDELVQYCVDNELYGIENLSMIPGTVGAAPIQNIGAYGVELKNVLEYLIGYSIEIVEKKKIHK